MDGEKAALIVDEKTYAQQLDLLRFQVTEIESARLKPDEENMVTKEHLRASNAARLIQLSQAALELLSDNDNSLQTQAGMIGRTLQELARVDATAAPLAELHARAVTNLGELQVELSRYADRMEVDPARLSELEERLNLIHSLKRKYGASLGEVIAFGEEAKCKLQALESRDAELARLDAARAKLDAGLSLAGKGLSACRRKLIPELARAVGKNLADLGFTQSRFEVQITATQEANPQWAAPKATQQFSNPCVQYGRIYGPGSNVVECAADVLRLLGHNMPPEQEAAE